MRKTETIEINKTKQPQSPTKKSILVLYTLQVLIEIFAVALTIGLVYSEVGTLSAGLITFMGGIIFAISGTFGLATIVSVPVKNTRSYKAHVAAFIMVLICCTIGILASLKSPLYGVISYTTLFVLIHFQIGLILF